MDLKRTRTAGFTLIEVMIAATVLVLVAMMGVMHVLRANQHLDWSRDKGFARERAVSILDELRAFVEGGDGEVAADLDGFDDGVSQSPVLTISYDPEHPGEPVPADHPASDNVMNQGQWRFWRRITVRPYGSVNSRDLRVVTVRVYRSLPGQDVPGDQLAEVSSIIRTVGDAYPTTQVYDVYLLALENAPGWWVHMDVIQPFIEAVLTDLQGRNRGLEFRTHWISKLGYGRDDEYAPYTNETRVTTDRTPWTYAYPGRLPEGEAAMRYYVAGRMKGRVNLDGEDAPVFVNGAAPAEAYVDADGDSRYDKGETFTDDDGDLAWDAGNPIPYALADMHNHCKRWPEAQARFQARVAAETEVEEAPTWRLLLDRMIDDPEYFHNAILINLHGELLPMPPSRNYSDPAKDPEAVPGWRVVTHPERLRPRRVPGDDVNSEAPRFRVYAWKSEFHDDDILTTQTEPYLDADGDGDFDVGETFEDWNGNGERDVARPISLVIRDGNFATDPNAATDPSIRITCLAGGVDGDDDGTPEPYADWADAPRYPETFTDTNADDIRQVAEPYFDLNGNGSRDDFEPWVELDGDGAWTAADEVLDDGNGNGVFDDALPAETFTDANGNGTWDPAEPYWDIDGNGVRTAATTPLSPWVPWIPAYYGDPVATAAYVASYGEPFLDLDGDKFRDDAEAFFDANGNGARDGGFEREEMWYQIHYDGVANQTVLRLHGTPLETPYVAGTNRGLPDSARLYDMDYVPCPTPDTAAGTDRFERDLYHADSTDPKNTARWVVELPLPSVRKAFETSFGAADGDADDRILVVETRLGTALDTGTMWPVRRDPQNASNTYAYFYEDPEDVPYSERHQILGDPRHCPYADTDATGTTAVHGYNWYFDNFTSGTGNAQPRWLAFDANRLQDGWLDRGGGHDVPRLMQWLRKALVDSEAVYTTLTGFSYYYLSIGGDVGSDSSNGFPNSIPMDGLPFGITTDVFENTITDGGGTSSIKGSLKYVRSNNGSTNGIRTGGYWWAKPWLGELFEDSAYATQWKPWGNLRANAGTSSGEYRMARRGDITTSQQPYGTDLVNRYARLKEEGCTTFFNVGTSNSTFHHQYRGGQSGDLSDQGPALAADYNFSIPDTAPISRPFGVDTNGSGGVGDEFAHVGSYPRYDADITAVFYDHDSGETGSGLVRLTAPAGDRSAFIVVNGIDKSAETGTSFIARYSMASLIHGFFVAGIPDGANPRIKQVPRVEIVYPTLTSELVDPVVVPLRWSTSWSRWDDQAYTDDHPVDFSETENDLVYVLMYSRDGGRTWLHMMDETPAEPGKVPMRIDGLGPDTAKTLTDLVPNNDEEWVWAVPDDQFPEGTYLVRIEVHRVSEALHYAHHVERVYVER